MRSKMSVIKRNRQDQHQLKDISSGESKAYNNGLKSSIVTKQTVEERRQTRYKKVQRTQRKNTHDLDNSPEKKCDDLSKYISR